MKVLLIPRSTLLKKSFSENFGAGSVDIPLINLLAILSTCAFYSPFFPFFFFFSGGGVGNGGDRPNLLSR